MNVLYLINHAGNGGSERYVELLANHVSQQGHKVYLAYNETGPLVEKLAHLTCYHIPMTSPFDLKAAKALKAYCQQEDIQVIHTQFARENYVAILSKFLGNQVKVVHTAHVHIENNLWWRMSNLLITRQNHQIIAVCESVKRLLVKNNYPEQKIQVIYNGTTLSERSGKGLQDTSEPVGFVTCARLSLEKGMDFLIDAGILLKQKGMSFTLTIAGDGPIETALKAKIAKAGAEDVIHMVGYIEDTQTLLSQNHVYVNASAHEALSFGIIEALSMGLPIIVTHVGGNTEIIKHSGAGVSVAYNDAVALAQAMAQMCADPDQFAHYQMQGKKAVSDVFNLDKVMAQTYQLYEKG